MMKDIFTKDVADEIVARINQLTPTTTPNWGKMTVDQMFAHCNVTYEMAYTNKYKKPNALMKFMLKTFVKKAVVSEKPYKKNIGTAPQFKMVGKKDYDKEKTRLVNYVLKTQELGSEKFEGKESHSFGKLTAKEWNNMFYKHLDHHLTQFGV